MRVSRPWLSVYGECTGSRVKVTSGRVVASFQSLEPTNGIDDNDLCTDHTNSIQSLVIYLYLLHFKCFIQPYYFQKIINEKNVYHGSLPSTQQMQSWSGVLKENHSASKLEDYHNYSKDPMLSVPCLTSPDSHLPTRHWQLRSLSYRVLELSLCSSLLFALTANQISPW